MTRTRLAVITGVLVWAAYVLAAMFSGHLDPLARRPVLDGFAPPAAYRWVKPPPSLAAANLKPTPGGFEVTLDPQSGSEPQVLTTPDAQVSVVLGQGSVPPRVGFSRIDITVTPQAPRAVRVTENLSIAGNVVRIEAAYAPGGPPVDAIGAGGQLVLFYPPPLDHLLHDHALLFSTDGITWKELVSQDAAAQQQVLATITQFGYFAVGEKSEGTEKPFPIGRVIYYALIIGGVGLIVVGIVVSELRRRRAKTKTKPGSAKTKSGSAKTKSGSAKTKRRRRDRRKSQPPTTGR
jgi:hypothetical protein